MKIVVLIENTAPDGLEPEWGLSLWIEYRGKKYLLDAGGSDKFVANAEKLDVSLAEAEAAILSHAHFDHSGGLEAFCALNDRAPVYVRREAEENCYSKHGLIRVYIGVQRGMLSRLNGRIVRVDGDGSIGEGITLVPHKQPDMIKRGRRAKMYIREGRRFSPDEFKHEQSLVMEVREGLVIFNSCSHGGVDSILDEVARTFPGRPILAMIGGFHLVRTPPREVHALARRLRAMGASELYTGHCTGNRAMEILEEELPGKVHRMQTGSRFEVGTDI
ncbi:MAG: MBL fold metallo-hydrolase [Candidatus Faecivicinus sp.]